MSDLADRLRTHLRDWDMAERDRSVLAEAAAELDRLFTENAQLRLDAVGLVERALESPCDCEICADLCDGYYAAFAALLPEAD